MKLSERFCAALVYAACLHGDQRRKVSDAPYVAHLMRVAGIALEHSADEDEAIAALLHDAIEDQGGRQARREIADRFGERVARIVDECTDTDRHPKPPWRPRKEAYLARLHSASASARLVSACDKLDNVRSILAAYRKLGEALWSRFNGGREGVLWYYRNVVNVLKQSGTNALIEELDRAVSSLEHVVGQAGQDQPVSEKSA